MGHSKHGGSASKDSERAPQRRIDGGRAPQESLHSAQCARTASFDAEAHSLAKVAQGQTYWDAKTRRTFKSRWSTIGPSHFDMV